MKRLFNMKMSEGGSITDHLNDFNTVTNQLSSVGVNFDDEVRALLILCSLPESWDGLVMAVSNFVSGPSTLKFDDFIGVILGEEMRRKSTGETSGNALTTKISCRERDGKRKTQNRQCLMILTKMKFQRQQKIKMINNNKKCLKPLQVLLENLPH